ncbi:MAG: hypothetical protein AAGL97_00820, partial [Pseudomonadota bacterium]
NLIDAADQARFFSGFFKLSLMSACAIHVARLLPISRTPRRHRMSANCWADPAAKTASKV